MYISQQSLEKIVQGIYVVAVALTAAVCFIIGVTTKVGKADATGELISGATQSFDHYVLVVSSEAFVFPGEIFPYNWFAFSAIAIVSVFMVIEIFATAVRKNPQDSSKSEFFKHNHAPAITTLIDLEIGHIR